jgi:PKHD-type hydroxylase
MKSLWYNYYSTIEENHIEDIKKKCLESNLVDGAIGTEANSLVNKDTRRSRVALLCRDKYADIYNLMYSYAVNANEFAYGFDITGIETCQFTKYNAEYSGKYDWHTDLLINKQSYHTRKISVMIQLSDPKDYEGGDFELREGLVSKEDKILMKKKGSVLTIPAFLEHRVTEVTKGERLSLVAWVTGLNFR